MRFTRLEVQPNWTDKCLSVDELVVYDHIAHYIPDHVIFFCDRDTCYICSVLAEDLFIKTYHVATSSNLKYLLIDSMSSQDRQASHKFKWQEEGF